VAEAKVVLRQEIKENQWKTGKSFTWWPLW